MPRCILVASGLLFAGCFDPDVVPSSETSGASGDDSATETSMVLSSTGGDSHTGYVSSSETGDLGTSTSGFDSSSTVLSESSTNGDNETSISTDLDSSGGALCESECTRPPSPVCGPDGDALIIYSDEGECQDGECVYDSSEIFCPGGCSEDTCQSDVWLPLPSSGSLSVRADPSMVWTGSELVVWGGAFGSEYHNDGARLSLSDSPAATWVRLPLGGAPTGRGRHLALWTGSEMIIWGGRSSAGSFIDDGGRFSFEDGWSTISTIDAPVQSNSLGQAVWTGTEMILWGGPFNCGRYDPLMDTWSPMSTDGAPWGSPLALAWTGTEVIAWGALQTMDVLGEGGLYDPTTDSWRPINPAGAPSARTLTGVWTGEQLIVWGGIDESYNYYNDTFVYDYSADAWTQVSSEGAPSGRRYHTSVWTGSEMIVWGGQSHNGDSTVPDNTGGVYNPETDSWRRMNDSGAPPPEASERRALWTGSEMIVLATPSSGGVGWRYLP